MIKFENVTKRYANGHEALSQVSFQLKKGEMAFLTGHSGAGKSTLLKLIALMERSSVGHVMVNKIRLTNLPARMVPMLRRSVGIIFQMPNLLDDRSVFDNVAMPLIIAGFRRQEIARRVRAALDCVGLLSKDKYEPLMLSGGEQQRVSIARAIVNKPAIILADEPTGNLDPQLSKEIMDLFSSLNRVGTSILVATHDINIVSKMNHRVITLDKGRLV